MTPTAPNFDRIARAYRWLEYLSLGAVLQRVRIHHLDRVLKCRNALLLGDGDGRFTAALLRKNTFVRVEAVDLSQSMLALLRHNATIAGGDLRLRTEQADARTFIPSGRADLIVTHFFLDCLTQSEVDCLIDRLAPSLALGGLWLVSDFRIPAGLMRWPARFYVRSLYFAFRLLTGLRVTRLPNHTAPLRGAGLHLLATHNALFGLLTSELWQIGVPGK